jgi:cyclic-di-GMP-binding biofilm dispersal mediator protein
VVARPPHMETGLANRPVAGEPPRLPEGKDPLEMARLVVAALAAGADQIDRNAGWVR